MASSHWLKLKNAPIMACLKPKKLNNGEFIIMTIESGIYKYNVNLDKWLKIFNSINTKCTYPIIAIDQTNELIYIGDSYIDEINIKKQSIKQIIKIGFSCEKMIVINDKIHLFSCRSHTTLNTKQNMHIRHTHIWDELYFRFIKYIKKNNSIFTVYLDCKNDCFKIGEYLLLNNTWNTFNINIPSQNNHLNYLFSAGIVMNKTEEYLIILGAPKHCIYNDIISIYDIKKNKFYKCSLKTPTKEPIQAICMNDNQRDELIVFGFVNHCYQAKEFKNLAYLPNYLINIIRKKVLIEYIHILTYDINTNQHWKIKVDDIIANIIV